MLNTVAISGVLGYPLELKKDKNGKSYIRSSVSVSRNYKGEDGYYLKDYIGFVAMGQNAEYLAKYAQKGDRIEIKGRMQSYAQTFWEYYEEDCFPKKREKKIYKIEILVEDVELHIRVISHGSEGMDMWSTAHFHMVVKEVGLSKKTKRRKMHYDY